MGNFGKTLKGDKLSNFKKLKEVHITKMYEKIIGKIFSNHDKKMLNFLYYDYKYIGYKFKNKH